MKIVFLDRKTIGEDIDLSSYNRFGEVIMYDFSYPNEVPDRVKDADIPTMKEIWENIDELQHLLDVNTGKIKDENSKKLTDTQIYKLKHTLISIRRGQYYLKDIFKPTSPHPINKMDFIPYEDAEDKPWNDEDSEYAFAPLGLIDNKGLGKKIFSNVE